MINPLLLRTATFPNSTNLEPQTSELASLCTVKDAISADVQPQLRGVASPISLGAQKAGNVFKIRGCLIYCKSIYGNKIALQKPPAAVPSGAPQKSPVPAQAGFQRHYPATYLRLKYHWACDHLPRISYGTGSASAGPLLSLHRTWRGSLVRPSNQKMTGAHGAVERYLYTGGASGSWTVTQGFSEL
ncbi:hypothetical protein NMY22_g5595 [Coprinellus aureogranulatus]|nr:hypothetical protein NMY22_g5595 [Coprinellus aureogranulatus]